MDGKGKTRGTKACRPPLAISVHGLHHGVLHAGLDGHSGNAAHHNCISGNAGGAMPGMPAIAVTDTSTTPVAYVDAVAHDYRLAPGDACLRVVGFDAAAQL